MAKILAAEGILLNAVNLIDSTVDPSVGGGVIAPIGSLYLRSGTGQAWLKTGAAATAWTQFVVGASTNVQVFSYTATGVEGSDFFVTLPAARANDLYAVQGTIAGAVSLFSFECTNLVAADRTTTQFRVITSVALTVGDVIDFTVQDKT